MFQNIWTKFSDAAKAAQARLLFEARAPKPLFKAALQADGTLEVLVYELIGEDFWSGEGVTAKSVKAQIDGAKGYSKIALRINSPGGDAFEGVAIHSLLRAQGKPVEVYVDGVAASAASIIAMAGDTIRMAPSALLMIHRAWGACAGFEDDHRAMADTLSKVSDAIALVYVNRTGLSEADVKAMMAAETWLSAQESVVGGFADEVVTEQPDDQDGVAALNAAREELAARRPVKAAACACNCENCAVGDCAGCVNEDCSDDNCQDCPIQSDDLEAARAVLLRRMRAA